MTKKQRKARQRPRRSDGVSKLGDGASVTTLEAIFLFSGSRLNEEGTGTRGIMRASRRV